MMRQHDKAGGPRTAVLLLVFVVVLVVAAYRLLVSRDPAPPEYEQGIHAAASGDVSGAETFFRAAIRHNPKYGPAYEWLADADLHQNQFGDVLQVLQQLHDVNPEYPHVVTRIAEASVSADPATLLRNAREAVLQEPRSPRAHMLLALGLARGADGRDARSQAATALELAGKMDRDNAMSTMAALPEPLAGHLVPLLSQVPYD